MTKNSFAEKARKEMLDITRTGIDNLLSVLDSSIVYPVNKSGAVDEVKLLAVVKSREVVYNEICLLMDLIEIDKSDNTSYKKKIIKGLKTTWSELTKITVREIGDASIVDFNNYIEKLGDNLDEPLEFSSRFNLSDDKLSPIAKSIGLSAELSFKIIDRIELLEDRESAQKKKINSKKVVGIAERYARIRK